MRILNYTPLVVIDGIGRVGKGTASKRVAEEFGFKHLDSGLLYRALTSRVLETGEHPMQAASRFTSEDLKRTNLRSEAVEKKVSEIAKILEVRQEINNYMREVTRCGNGWVMDGRAGAQEFPSAHVRVFLTASDEVCANRACQALTQDGKPADYNNELAIIRARNLADTTRGVFPAVAGKEASVIDTSDMNASQVYEEIFLVMQKVLPSRDFQLLFAWRQTMKCAYEEIK